MGAIVSDFPSLPANGPYVAVYADLTTLGLALPPQPADVITRAQLLAHLQGLAGAIIKAELSADPETLYTGGPTDAQLAVIISTDFVPTQARRLPGSSPTGYQVVAGSTVNALVLGVNLGLANPGFLTLNGLLPLAIIVRMRNSVAAPANRGFISGVIAVSSDTTLGIGSPLPVAPTVGDICELGFVAPKRVTARFASITIGLPHAPNAVTAADIAAAKV